MTEPATDLIDRTALRQAVQRLNGEAYTSQREAILEAVDGTPPTVSIKLRAPDVLALIDAAPAAKPEAGGELLAVERLAEAAHAIHLGCMRPVELCPFPSRFHTEWAEQFLAALQETEPGPEGVGSGEGTG